MSDHPLLLALLENWHPLVLVELAGAEDFVGENQQGVSNRYDSRRLLARDLVVIGGAGNGCVERWEVPAEAKKFCRQRAMKLAVNSAQGYWACRSTSCLAWRSAVGVLAMSQATPTYSRTRSSPVIPGEVETITVLPNVRNLKHPSDTGSHCKTSRCVTISMKSVQLDARFETYG
jgi:hypothetical protein